MDGVTYMVSCKAAKRGCKFTGLFFLFQTASTATSVAEIPLAYLFMTSRAPNSGLEMVDITKMLVIGEGISNLPLVLVLAGLNINASNIINPMCRIEPCVLIPIQIYRVLFSAIAISIGLSFIDPSFSLDRKNLWVAIYLSHLIVDLVMYAVIYSLCKLCCGKDNNQMPVVTTPLSSITIHVGPASFSFNLDARSEQIVFELREHSYKNSLIGKRITELGLRDNLDDPRANIPDRYLDPVLMQLILDPVRVANGNLYDRASINAWFMQRRNLQNLRAQRGERVPDLTDPLWGTILENDTLTTDTEIEKEILIFIDNLSFYNARQTAVAAPSNIELTVYKQHCAANLARVAHRRSQISDLDFNMV